MNYSSNSFTGFITGLPENRRYGLIAAGGVILQFIIFKLLYPYADFFGDSYSYIEAAQFNLDVSVWPIGYSKFLLLVHYFTHSDTAVVALQYFILEAASLYFFFSLLYFFQPGRKTKIILFIFLFFNPLFLYISNYINSDPLFAALSLVWFTQLIWIIYRPALMHLIFHAVVLFLAFTVRNNAYFYPFITAFAFVLSSYKIWVKVLGAFLPVLLILPFVLHTRNAAYKMTGTKQFSFFTGWQLANNALYGYPGMEIDSADLPTKESLELYRLTKEFYHDVPKDFNTHYLGTYIGNFFIKEPTAPLKQFLASNYPVNNKYDVIVAWGKASAAFAPYGSYLMKKYPWAYIRYFMILNTKNYFIPPLEKLNQYNLGMNFVEEEAQDWFDYPTPYVSSFSPTLQGKLLMWVPHFFLMLNVYCIGALVWFLVSRKYLTASRHFNHVIWISTAFITINASFSIFAAMIVFRYEFFPMIILLSFPLILVDRIDLKKKNTSDCPDNQLPQRRNVVSTN